MTADDRRGADIRAGEREKLGRLMLALRARGVTDPAVLGALEATPRRLFVGAEHLDRAVDDRPLPIECGQTISAPSMVGVMLQALVLGPDMKLLEVGAGSGWAAAVASRLCRRVVAVERFRTLVDLARTRVAALRIENVHVQLGDGRDGAPETAPYDRILVSAAGAAIPTALVRQLKPTGVLVMPVGPEGGPQTLVRLTRTDRGDVVEELGAVRFVPLVEGVAEAL